MIRRVRKYGVGKYGVEKWELHKQLEKWFVEIGVNLFLLLL